MTDPRFATITAPLARVGRSQYGEAITQIEHALQCGALAMAAGEDDTMVVAALLHDIGQCIADAGAAAQVHGTDARHETLGADFLAQWFDTAITAPVRLHVAAKRYLCATDAGYAEALSAASQRSLVLQGGAMDAAEMAAFRDHRWHAEALRLRHYDDAAKRVGCVVPDLFSHHDRIITAIAVRD